MLKHLVDGQHQRLPLFGGIVQLVVLTEGVAIAVGKSDRAARGAGEHVIILLFQTGEALFVGTHTAQHMSKEAAVGIIACRVIQKVQRAVQLVCVHKLPHHIGLILFHATHEHLIGAVLVDLGRDILGGDLFQQGGQGVDDQLDAVFPDGGLLGIGEGVFFILFQPQQCPLGISKLCRLLGRDLTRVENEHFGAGRDGQRLSVGIINGAPGGVQGDVASLVVQRLLLVKILIDDLQKGQPDDDSGSAQDTKNRHHKHDAAPGMTVSFTVKLGHIGSFSGKTRKIVGPSKCENGARRTMTPYSSHNFFQTISTVQLRYSSTALKLCARRLNRPALRAAASAGAAAAASTMWLPESISI